MIKRNLLAKFLSISLLCANEMRAGDSASALYAVGSWFQIVSLHLGTNIDLNAPNVNNAFSIGVSVGWNNIGKHRGDYRGDYSEVPIGGLRFKYMYANNTIPTYSIGLIGYYYPISYRVNNEVAEIMNKFSSLGFGFAFGVGAIFAEQDSHFASGGYIEAGITLIKHIPINLDILYKISFYGDSPIFLDKRVTHSLQFVFTLF